MFGAGVSGEWRKRGWDQEKEEKEEEGAEEKREEKGDEVEEDEKGGEKKVAVEMVWKSIGGYRSLRQT